jgi:hypothetical protein
MMRVRVPSSGNETLDSADKEVKAGSMINVLAKKLPAYSACSGATLGVPRRGETRSAVPRYRDFRERARFFDAPFLRFRDWPDSDIAIAIACLRLFTLPPLLLRRAPRLCSPITFEILRFCRLVAMNPLRNRGVGQADAAPDQLPSIEREEVHASSGFGASS